MSLTCGKYLHYKGNFYIVYAKVKTVFNEEYVLYRADYGSKDFWIRPVNMFFEKINDGTEKETERFKFVTKIKFKKLFAELLDNLKKENIIVKHSETKEIYTFFSIDEDNNEIIVAKSNDYSSYLTDTQLARRMGFDLYKVNKKIVVKKTCFPVLDRERFEIISVDDQGVCNLQENIIKNQMNSCSIDLHISDEFYIPKHKKIDMSNVLQYATKASDLWRKKYLKDINGSKGIVLWPNQSIVTCTYEKICLPLDCAGKVEIKSTYARLSLSVTVSDFCNPGWKGKFPLTIRNNGKQRIVIHPKEKMLQISLIPTQSPIANEYSQRGVFMDDDGTPFRFWRSQTVKRINGKEEQDKVLNFCKNVVEEIEKNSDDVESEKERFNDTFLSYYVKKSCKKKYKDMKNIKEKLKVLWKKYKSKEKILKIFFSKPAKFSAVVGTIFLPIMLVFIEYYLLNEGTFNKVVLKAIILFVMLVLALICFIVKSPNYYCSFEKLDFDKIYNNKDLDNI